MPFIWNEAVIEWVVPNEKDEISTVADPVPPLLRITWRPVPPVLLTHKVIVKAGLCTNSGAWPTLPNWKLLKDGICNQNWQDTMKCSLSRLHASQFLPEGKLYHQRQQTSSSGHRVSQTSDSDRWTFLCSSARMTNPPHCSQRGSRPGTLREAQLMQNEQGEGQGWGISEQGLPSRRVIP